MRPHWNRNHARNVEAANDRLRQRYADRRENISTIPFAVPDKLKRAIGGPRWSGEPVLVTANGRDVAAVLGTESTDAWAIWRDITAAVQADEGTGTRVRLIPPAPLAEGLRAVAVPSGQQVVVWQSSAGSVTNRQRRIAARRALRALDGHQVPAAVRLSLLVPGWRKAVPIAAVATAVAVVAVLISAGQIWPLNRRPSPPPAAATRQATAGTAHDPAPAAPSSGPVGRRRSSRGSRPAAGRDAPSRHGRTGTLATGRASSPGRASATRPQPSPTRTSSSPSPQPTATKKCALWVLRPAAATWLAGPPSRYLRISLACLSVGAAVIHFAVMTEHFAQYWLFGAFFAVVAWAQLAWAAAIIWRPTRPLLLAGAAGNAAVLAVYLLSRTTGLPIGPGSGTAEPAGGLDVACSVFELLILAGRCWPSPRRVARWPWPAPLEWPRGPPPRLSP